MSFVTPCTFPHGGQTPMRPPPSMKASNNSLTGGKPLGMIVSTAPDLARLTPSRVNQITTSWPNANALLPSTNGIATRSGSCQKLVRVNIYPAGCAFSSDIILLHLGCPQKRGRFSHWLRLVRLHLGGRHIHTGAQSVVHVDDIDHHSSVEHQRVGVHHGIHRDLLHFHAVSRWLRVSLAIALLRDLVHPALLTVCQGDYLVRGAMAEKRHLLRDYRQRVVAQCDLRLGLRGERRWQGNVLDVR